MRLVVFDCDGTLVDSQYMIHEAMKRASATINVESPDLSIVRRVVGLSLDEAMARLFPDLGQDQLFHLVEGYKGAFQTLRDEMGEREMLYPGIKRLVNALDKDGYLLAVATGKSMRGLTRTLDHHGMSDMFISLQTADHHPGKPHPSMIEKAMAEAGAAVHQTVMIGDTSFDMQMAKNARVGAIGVDWGYHEVDELLNHGAESVVTDSDHLGREIKHYFAEREMA